MSSNISIAEEVNALDTVRSAKKSKLPPLGKAPFMLRDSKQKYFEPRAVALGPVHHSNQKYQQAEEFKQILATKFISESGSPSPTLFRAVRDKIGPLRNRYEEVETENYSDDELALILLTDGCAVLQFIQSVVDHTLKSMVKNDLSAFAVHDLFLLENQLPFDLLRVLMDQHKGGKEMFLKSIQVFIDSNVVLKSKQEWKVPSGTNHLLGLMRERMLLCSQKTEEPKNNDQGREPRPTTGSSSHTNDSLNDHTSIPMPEHVTNQQSKDNQGASHRNGSKGEDSQSSWQTFRNVMVLKAAGIYAEPSETNSLKDFDYEEGKLWYGTMKMPCIRVDNSTVPQFLNMIAYEMHPEFENEGEVSSYICLMDMLIDDADDVKELRKAKILHNMLGSDKDVADVFNTISTDLVPNPETYCDFLAKIQNHYDTEWKATVAQWFHDYFSTPWTTLIVLGFILSFIQALSGFIN